MATQIVTYKTKDGKTFSDAASADKHEAGLALVGQVNAYIESLSFERAESERGVKLSKARLKRKILDALVWMQANPEATVVVEEDAEIEAEAAAETVEA